MIRRQFASVALGSESPQVIRLFGLENVETHPLPFSSQITASMPAGRASKLQLIVRQLLRLTRRSTRSGRTPVKE
jgi:hypothetical protein